MSAAYYNEYDPKPAAWLSELGRAGHIMPGLVDTTSITDLLEVPDGFTRYHFFSGIGGWDYALRLAGWPAALPVWTGSCPCQPFSTAGKGLGERDPRHLWPDFRRLIAKHRPAVVFGEQVASAAGRAWLAGVRADLEALGYAVGAADLCAAGVGAPHIRQRLYWVAYAHDGGRQPGHGEEGGAREALRLRPGALPGDGREAGGVADSKRDGRGTDEPQRGPEGRAADGRAGQGPRGLVDAAGAGREEPQRLGGVPSGAAQSDPGEALERAGAWGRFDIIPCRDGKSRRIEPGLTPLAHGVPGRVGLLRGYGNAIVPQVAAVFIQGVMDAVGIRP